MLITTDELFKIARCLDNKILKNFDDDKLNNRDYFFYAINSDIFSSVGSLICNLKTENSLSCGVDYNCRTIIEAFTLLKMLALGEISDEQLFIFRNQYIIVDYLNQKKMINKTQNTYSNRIKERYKEAIRVLEVHYNCKEKVLIEHFVDDPNFFLKKNINDKTNFYSLVEKYKPIDEKIGYLYSYFSILSHPNFINDKDMALTIYHNRQNYIDFLLDYVCQYLENSNFKMTNSDELSFDELFTNNALLYNNKVNLQSFELSIESVIKQTCYFEDGINRNEMFFLRNLEYLIKDMLIALSLDYKEQVIAKFKNFIELISVHSFINHAESKEEYDVFRKAFYLSTHTQFGKFTSDVLSEQRAYFKKDWKELFDKYYCFKYKEKNFEKFYQNVTKNSLYFIFEDSKSYKRVAKQMLEDIYSETPDLKEHIFVLFQIANDYAHAGGYAFNSNDGAWHTLPHLCLMTVWQYLIILLRNIEDTSKDHNRKVDFKNFYDFYALMYKMSFEQWEKESQDFLSKIN